MTLTIMLQKHAALWLAVFLVVFGARVWLIDHYVTDVPFYDQWDAEANGLFAPAVRGELTSAQILAPHNEHRIVLTRLLALNLFRANDSLWDPKLEMVVNALLAAFTAMLVFAVLEQTIPSKFSTALFVVVTLVWSLPYGWENTLAGFQSQFFLMQLLAFIALWELSSGEEFTWHWWLGAVAGILACLTMASGFFAIAAAAGVRLGRWVLDLRASSRPLRPTAAARLRSHAGTLLLALFVAVAAVVYQHHVPENDSLRAQNLYYFLKTLVHSLSWPLLRIPVALLLFYYPAFLLLRGLFNKSIDPSPLDWRLCAVLLWVVLQAVAISYARGVNGHMPTSRYTDILAIGCLVNFVILATRFQPAKPRTLWIMSAAAAIGLLWLTVNNFQHLPEQRLRSEAQMENCREYIAHGDPKILHPEQPGVLIPYPNPEQLAGYLDDKTIRSFLNFSTENLGKIGTLSTVSNQLLQTAPWYILGGVLLAAVSIHLRLRSSMNLGLQKTRDY